MENTALPVETAQAYSVKHVCEWFWEIETRLDLLSQQDDGVYYWRLLRMPLYYALTEKLALFGEPHPLPSPTLPQRLQKLFRIATDSLFRNPHLSFRRYDSVVMPHSRAVGGDDIYTRTLRDWLRQSKVLTLYKDWNGQQLPHSYNVSGAILWNYLLKRWKKSFALSPESRTLLTEVQQNIVIHFGVHLPVVDMAHTQVAQFSKAVCYYTALFQRCKAKTLYLVVGYVNLHCAAIEAARRCAMRVIELQHGTFTPYHLGYSFPHSRTPIPYSPDRMLCFGQFWPETTALPCQTTAHIIGAPYIQTLAGTLSNTHKTSNSITFTSQGVIGEQLVLFALECAHKLPKKQIIFRLHPSENLDTYQRLLTTHSLPANFSLSHGSPNIFRLLAETEIQAGVFSTTLFEGMVLGCKTIVIDMPGVEYMESVISKGDALLVKSPQEFCARIHEAPLCRDAAYYYATPCMDFDFLHESKTAQS